MGWREREEKAGPTTAVLLNGHVVKQPSKYLCLYRDGGVLNLDQRSLLCSGQQLMKRFLTGQNAETK